MITLRNKATGETIGDVTPADIQFMQDQMEEDRADDNDYYINEAELQAFEEAGASPALIEMLRENLDENGELDITWG